MVTRLNERKNGGRKVPDTKRVTFDRGQAKSSGGGLPMKTTDVQKE